MQSYDNLKTVVDCIFVGKERQFNRRFMALANHYLFETVACTPAAGWEKGQIENQVGHTRRAQVSENGCLRHGPGSRALTR